MDYVDLLSMISYAATEIRAGRRARLPRSPADVPAEARGDGAERDRAAGNHPAVHGARLHAGDNKELYVWSLIKKSIFCLEGHPAHAQRHRGREGEEDQREHEDGRTQGFRDVFQYVVSLAELT